MDWRNKCKVAQDHKRKAHPVAGDQKAALEGRQEQCFILFRLLELKPEAAFPSEMSLRLHCQEF